MLLLGPFRTTHSYFDKSVSICPTSVSHYKWTLSKHPSVHAKCQVNTFNHVTEIALIQFSSGGPERTVYLQTKMPSVPREKYSGDGLESSRQGCRMETLQVTNEGDLHGRPGTRGEAVCPHTCGRR